MNSSLELEVPKLLSPTPSCSSLSTIASKDDFPAEETPIKKRKSVSNVVVTKGKCVSENVVYPRGTAKKGQPKKTGIYDISEVADWYDDYQYVLFGYRQFYTLGALCRNALTTIHNETMNIYTELIPGIVYLWIACYYMHSFVVIHHDQLTVFTKVLICMCFPMGGLRCLMSAYVHATHCYNEEHSFRTWNKDYVSILSYIFSTTLMNTYLCGHYANESTSESAWSTYVPLGVSVCACFSVAVVGICHLNLRRQKPAKELIFKLVVVFGNYVILLYHLVAHCTWSHVPTFVSILFNAERPIASPGPTNFPTMYTVYWLLGSIFTYLAAELRQAKFPEKWFVAPTVRASANATKDLTLLNDDRLLEQWLANDRCLYAALCSKFRKLHHECDCTCHPQCDVECHCHTQTTHVFQHIDLSTAFKYWYFFLLPSHTLWHICTNASHFFVLYSWIAFFESRVNV
ncbi:hypothetical protein RFI_11131 [Reticulomyxa filosa]|uniref:Uncharacterized protein n=1 Tax=Reticulomyxa filosa TaxID=46433 RepID=X6NJW0_RETFI|nr:hypothetical protein RFI_11131 [Reticulomyxa filosa]|eukprot:ETO26009.1 hypothetical protein RFI_11131 [Reticulomyxa filosa]